MRLRVLGVVVFFAAFFYAWRSNLFEAKMLSLVSALPDETKMKLASALQVQDASPLEAEKIRFSGDGKAVDVESSDEQSKSENSVHSDADNSDSAKGHGNAADAASSEKQGDGDHSDPGNINDGTRLDGDKADEGGTNASKRLPAFYESDRVHFERWKERSGFEGEDLPRLLMYTWLTEDTFTSFLNENYWKSCYAHMHGFDIVFSTKMNFTGVAKYTHPGMTSNLGKWYSEENMWAWWSDIKEYLFSGKYDYVWMSGVDTQLQWYWSHWPIWAWDTGNDISMMDQEHFAGNLGYGLNENDLLFRPTDFSKRFLEDTFEFRRGFHLQGDNGPYMESLLRTIGSWEKSQGREGYNDLCLSLLNISAPSVLLLTEKWWGPVNNQYSRCFFGELSRMAGIYGYRKTRGIGFYPSFIGFDNKAFLPDQFREGAPFINVPANHPHFDKLPLGPWANCWSSVRMNWRRPDYNCFAYHLNGPKNLLQHSYVSGGTCPDPTFDWEGSKWNPVNRKAEMVRYEKALQRKKKKKKVEVVRLH